jgi:hypothetical protein
VKTADGNADGANGTDVKLIWKNGSNTLTEFNAAPGANQEWYNDYQDTAFGTANAADGTDLEWTRPLASFTFNVLKIQHNDNGTLSNAASGTRATFNIKITKIEFLADEYKTTP